MWCTNRLNIQEFYILLTIYLCVLYLSQNIWRRFPIQHKRIGFYNQDEKCLLRGKNWIFK